MHREEVHEYSVWYAGITCKTFTGLQEREGKPFSFNLTSLIVVNTSFIKGARGAARSTNCAWVMHPGADLQRGALKAHASAKARATHKAMKRAPDGGIANPQLDPIVLKPIKAHSI